MRIGDLVRIKQQYPEDWPEAEDCVGVIVSFGKRLYIPAAKVMVLCEFVEFDLDELEVINANR